MFFSFSPYQPRLFPLTSSTTHHYLLQFLLHRRSSHHGIHIPLLQPKLRVTSPFGKSVKLPSSLCQTEYSFRVRSTIHPCLSSLSSRLRPYKNVLQVHSPFLPNPSPPSTLLTNLHKSCFSNIRNDIRIPNFGHLTLSFSP